MGINTVHGFGMTHIGMWILMCWNGLDVPVTVLVEDITDDTRS